MGDTDGEPQWLSAQQQATWRQFVAIMTRLPAALDTQLQQDSRLTHFDYFVLSTLSEAPDRRLRLRDLAEFANASLSRLSHAPVGPTPIGVFRDVEAPRYDELVREQVTDAVAARGRGRLEDLLAAGNVWDVVD